MNILKKLAFLAAIIIAGAFLQTRAEADSLPYLMVPSSAGVIVGTPFSLNFTLIATSVTVSAQNLPPGLVLRYPVGTSGAMISGTPTRAGVFNVILKATNSAGTATAATSITVFRALGDGNPVRLTMTNNTVVQMSLVELSSDCPGLFDCGDGLPWNNFYFEHPLGPGHTLSRTVGVNPDRLQWNAVMIPKPLGSGANCQKTYTSLPTSVSVLPVGTNGCVIF